MQRFIQTKGIILAAGRGLRMKSKTAKPFHHLGGEYLVSHVINSMQICGIEEIIVIISPDIQKNKELLKFTSGFSSEIKFVVQKTPRGTGDALLQGVALVSDDDLIVVAACDVPLVTSNSINNMIHDMNSGNSCGQVLVARVPDPTGYGRVKVDGKNSNVKCIIEEDDLNHNDKDINLINTSWYCFDTGWVRGRLNELQQSKNGEIQLTDVVKFSNTSNIVSLSVLDDHLEAIGINSKIDLSNAEKILQDRIGKKWMLAGVTIIDPDTTYIDSSVIIHPDSTLYPGTHLKGSTLISAGAMIGPNSIIENSKVGEKSKIISSHVSDSVIGPDVVIGSNARIRNGTRVGHQCVLGNGVEVKNSTIGEETKISHFSYIGDAKIGKHVNIGAGTVTCNYDGQFKHETFIDDDVFIGSGTMLIAPVKIFSKAKTGAGSVVTKNIKSDIAVKGVPARPYDREPTINHKDEND